MTKKTIITEDEAVVLDMFLPDDIKTLIAEHGEVARLARYHERLINKGQPDFMSDEGWRVILDNYKAILKYRSELDAKISNQVSRHEDKLKVRLKWIKRVAVFFGVH